MTILFLNEFARMSEVPKHLYGFAATRYYERVVKHGRHRL